MAKESDPSGRPLPPPPAPAQPLESFNIEEGKGKALDFTETSIQKAFLRKVYGILSCQLLVTLGVILLFLKVESIKLWTRENPKFLIGVIIVTIFCMLSMACCNKMRRKTPLNYICLGIFTVAESILLGFLSSFKDTDVVLMAAGITAAICMGLTIYGLQTKSDFTVVGGILICAFISFLVFCNLAVFYSHLTSHALKVLYASLGAFTFSIILVIDTQVMMQGDHKYSISPEDYVFAALNLYLDIINIFMYIVHCISGNCD